jgi:hypothetical protein
MLSRWFAVAGSCCALLLSRSVCAQSPSAAPVAQPFDPVAIVELGGALSRDSRGGTATGSPNFAVEVTPIDDVLELEAGVSPVFRHRSTEWDVDFLFKKPWTISSKAEFMIGVGPAWTIVRGGGSTASTLAGEIAADFMLWPSGGHHAGLFAEPAYDYGFAAGHPQSAGVSAGLLIGIP